MSDKAVRLLILHKSTVALGVCASSPVEKGLCYGKAKHAK
jgi:hypothetical protein